MAFRSLDEIDRYVAEHGEKQLDEQHAKSNFGGVSDSLITSWKTRKALEESKQQANLTQQWTKYGVFAAILAALGGIVAAVASVVMLYR